MKLGTAVITKNWGAREKKPEVLNDLEYVYSTCLEIIKIKTDNQKKTLSSKELLQTQKGFQMIKKYNELVLNKMLDNGIISDVQLERFELMTQENEKSVQESIEQQMMKNTRTKPSEKFSFKQKIAKFMQDKSVFTKIPFVKKFIDRNLNVLPSHEEETYKTMSEERERFLRELSDDGQYRGQFPQIQTDIVQRRTQTRYSEHDENESR